MFLKKILEQHPKTGANGRGNGHDRPGDTGPVHAALLRISSMIMEKKETDKILEFIVQESLKCLDAHRSTMFVLDDKSGILKTQYAIASEIGNEQVSLYEEKEVARKALKQKRPLLLREPEDFADFFNYEKRERKISSLLSVPLYRIHPPRIQSLALIEESRRFTESDLESFSIFTNQAAIALELAALENEIAGGFQLRKDHDTHVDIILDQLQTLLRKERERCPGGRGGPVLKPLTGDDLPAKRDEKVTCGGAPLAPGEAASSPAAPEEESENARKESDFESLCFGEDFKSGGLFVRTPNPMELGEKILLNVRIPDGQDDVIGLQCKVVWTNKYGKENKHLRRGMGVKIVDVAPDTRKRLEKFFYLNENKELSSEYWRMSVVN